MLVYHSSVNGALVTRFSGLLFHHSGDGSHNPRDGKRDPVNLHLTAAHDPSDSLNTISS